MNVVQIDFKLIRHIVAGIKSLVLWNYIEHMKDFPPKKLVIEEILHCAFDPKFAVRTVLVSKILQKIAPVT